MSSFDVNVDEKAPSWRSFFHLQQQEPYYQQLQEFVRQERAQSSEIYPPQGEVFQAFKSTPLARVRVVIVGQDPYHGPNQAHGLSFSVREGITPPPSLENIFKEVGQRGSSDLSRWAEQGVLLLNTLLTVRRGEPFSHKGRGWENFTDAALSYLQRTASDPRLERRAPLIYFLWGKPAQEKVRKALLHKPSLLESKRGQRADLQNPMILCAPHPSPLSAYRGFFGCSHFQKANELLLSYGEEPIHW